MTKWPSGLYGEVVRTWPSGLWLECAVESAS